MRSHANAPNTASGRTTISILDLVVTIILTTLQLVLGWAFRLVIAVLSMRSTGCTPAEVCNFDVAAAAISVMPIVAVAAVILTIVSSIVFARRGRPLWHAAGLGVVLVSVVFVIAAAVNYWALTPSVG